MTYTLLCDLMKTSTRYTLKHSTPTTSYKTLSSVMIALSWILVELVGNGEVLETLVSVWITQLNCYVAN